MSHHNKLKVKFYYELSEFIAVSCRQQMMLLECWMLILIRVQDMNRSALTPGARCSSMMTNSLTLAEILGDVGDSELPSNNTDIISWWWSDVITITTTTTWHILVLADLFTLSWVTSLTVLLLVCCIINKSRWTL